MARPFMALAGSLLLAASGGCSGGYGPGPETNDGGHRNWPDAVSGIHDILPPEPVSVCGHDAGGMFCPRSAPIQPIAGTCTYPLPCEAFAGVGTRVYANDTQLPRDFAGGNSWSYADGGLMISINGQLCEDIMSGASIEITFDSSCTIIP